MEVGAPAAAGGARVRARARSINPFPSPLTWTPATFTALAAKHPVSALNTSCTDSSPAGAVATTMWSGGRAHAATFAPAGSGTAPAAPAMVTLTASAVRVRDAPEEPGIARVSPEENGTREKGRGRRGRRRARARGAPKNACPPLPTLSPPSPTPNGTASTPSHAAASGAGGTAYAHAMKDASSTGGSAADSGRRDLADRGRTSVREAMGQVTSRVRASPGTAWEAGGVGGKAAILFWSGAFPSLPPSPARTRATPAVARSRAATARPARGAGRGMVGVRERQARGGGRARGGRSRGRPIK